MRTLVIVGSSIALVGASFAVFAQSVPDKEIAQCSVKTSTVERITCFDDLAKRHSLAPSVNNTTPATKTKWRTLTKADPLTDRPTYTAMLIADSGVGVYRDPIALLVRCQGNKTEAYIDWSSFLGMDYARTTYRVDKQPAKTSNWGTSTDHKAAFFPSSPVAFLKQLANSTSFVANVTPYDESPITAVFDTTGAADALADIRKGCGW